MITALGSDAVKVNSHLQVGDRVGIPWVQKICGNCLNCENGSDNFCSNGEDFGQHNVDQGTWGTGGA